jgi:transcriptional regulator with XRE-family HTH domain
VPRLNPGRSIASEANLAKRIAYERHQRELSYEGLASLMTEQGCAIQGSAIYKIEKGDPPRRVTVDELVALARVFDVTTDELLTRMDLIEKRQAKELIDEVNHLTDLLADLTVRLFNYYSQYFALAVDNPALQEYVDHRLDAAAKGDFPVAVMPDPDDVRLNEAAVKLSGNLYDFAVGVVTGEVRKFLTEVASLAGENVVNAAAGREAGLAWTGRVG